MQNLRDRIKDNTAWRSIEKPDNFQISPEKWTLLCHNAFFGWHTLIVGPTGAGKTSIVRHVANSLGKNFVPINCGELSDAIGALKGTVHLRRKGQAMETVFVRSNLVNAIAGANNLILLDEVTRSAPEVVNQLFSILDHQRRIELQEECPPTTLTLGEGTVFFATANIGSQYSGTTPIDLAFRDRFMLVVLGYLTLDNEVQIILSKANIPEKTANQLAAFSSEVRRLHERGELPAPWSPRQNIRAAQLVEHGFPLTQAILLVAEGLYYEEGGDADEYMGKVKQVLQKL